MFLKKQFLSSLKPSGDLNYLKLSKGMQFQSEVGMWLVGNCCVYIQTVFIYVKRPLVTRETCYLLMIIQTLSEIKGSSESPVYQNLKVKKQHLLCQYMAWPKNSIYAKLIKSLHNLVNSNTSFPLAHIIRVLHGLLGSLTCI